MIRSGTIPKNRNSDVVVANDPMPSVSKKLVTAPTPSESGVGGARSVAGDGAAPRVPRSAIMVFAQPATNITVSAASAASNPVIGFIWAVAYNRSRQLAAHAFDDARRDVGIRPGPEDAVAYFPVSSSNATPSTPASVSTPPPW